MIRPRAERPGAVPAALAQTAAGLAAHAAAAGCLPDIRALLLLAPTTVGAVLLVSRVLADRPLLRLASGQLAVHAVLALAACAGAAHLHASGGPHTAMTAAHVGALVACRAGLERAGALATAALGAVLNASLARLVRPLALVSPVSSGTGQPAGSQAVPRPSAVLLLAPGRGPPAAHRLLPT